MKECEVAGRACIGALSRESLVCLCALWARVQGMRYTVLVAQV